MTFKQLELFMAILEHSSFSAGARAAFVSQSTASQAIAVLEEELGVRLLERTRRSVRATQAGELFRKHARTLLAEEAAARAQMEKFRGVAKTLLRVAASTIPGAYLVPPVVKKLCDKNPALEVVLLQGDSRETVERVFDREVDLGIVGDRFEEKGLSYTPVGGDEIRLVVSGEDPLASRKSITLAELKEVPIVLREHGSGTARTVLKVLNVAGIPATSLKVRAYMGSSEAVKAAVMAGMGAAFLSEIAVTREVERGDFKVIGVEGLTISRNFFLVKRIGTELSGAARLFSEEILSTYGAGQKSPG